MYTIQPYTQERAKQIGVTVRPSLKKNKKIDVYKDDVFLNSIGDRRYKDYPTFLLESKQLAESRRRAYHTRHTRTNKLGELLALWLLW